MIKYFFLCYYFYIIIIIIIYIIISCAIISILLLFLSSILGTMPHPPRRAHTAHFKGAPMWHALGPPPPLPTARAQCRFVCAGVCTCVCVCRCVFARARTMAVSADLGMWQH